VSPRPRRALPPWRTTRPRPSADSRARTRSPPHAPHTSISTMMASTTVRLSAPIAHRGVAAPTRTTARSSSRARVVPVARVASVESVVIDAKASRDDDSLVSRGQVREDAFTLDPSMRRKPRSRGRARPPGARASDRGVAEGGARVADDRRSRRAGYGFGYRLCFLGGPFDGS